MNPTRYVNVMYNTALCVLLSLHPCGQLLRTTEPLFGGSSVVIHVQSQHSVARLPFVVRIFSLPEAANGFDLSFRHDLHGLAEPLQTVLHRFVNAERVFAESGIIGSPIAADLQRGHYAAVGESETLYGYQHFYCDGRGPVELGLSLYGDCPLSVAVTDVSGRPAASVPVALVVRTPSADTVLATAATNGSGQACFEHAGFAAERYWAMIEPTAHAVQAELAIVALIASQDPIEQRIEPRECPWPVQRMIVPEFVPSRVRFVNPDGTTIDRPLWVVAAAPIRAEGLSRLLAEVSAVPGASALRLDADERDGWIAEDISDTGVVLQRNGASEPVAARIQAVGGAHSGRHREFECKVDAHSLVVAVVNQHGTAVASTSVRVQLFEDIDQSSVEISQEKPRRRRWWLLRSTVVSTDHLGRIWIDRAPRRPDDHGRSLAVVVTYSNSQETYLGAVALVGRATDTERIHYAVSARLEDMSDMVVRGTVEDSHGKRMAGATVRALEGQCTLAVTGTDDDGRFELPVMIPEPGSVVLCVQGKDGREDVVDITVPSEGPIRVQLGEP